MQAPVGMPIADGRRAYPWRVFTMTSNVPTRGTALRRLAKLFRRNGYVRWQNTRRLSKEGYSGYKKGDEVRLVAGTRQELAEVRRLLRAAGFKPGRPFRKANQYRQPLYGRVAVARFLVLVLGEKELLRGKGRLSRKRQKVR